MLSRDRKKQASACLRFLMQRLPALIFTSLLVFGFVGPLFVPDVYWVVVWAMHVFLLSNCYRLAIGLVITSVKTANATRANWVDRYHRARAKATADNDDAKIISTSDASETHITINETVDAVDTVDENNTKSAERRSAGWWTWWRRKRQVEVLESDRIRHVIIVPNYKEEFETLCETLDTLAQHDSARHAYKVIMAMEEGEQGAAEKAEKLIALFGSHFFQMHYTIHPAGIPGEARGKSSNVAWASTYYAKHWLDADATRYEIITVMDADTHLTQKYFEAVNFNYCTSTRDEHARSMFAPTLVFDRNANDVPFVTRLADMCWSIGLMSIFQMPVRFPCSVYSVSMLLAQRVNFWDAGPDAIGEDLHMSIKCWMKTDMKLKLTPIYIPASCSCVQADTYLGTIAARFSQSKRHLWGLLDLGYTAAGLLSYRCWYRAPFKSLLLFYLLFEIFYQPFFGIYQIFGTWFFPSALESSLGYWTNTITTYIRYSFIPSAIVLAIAYEVYHYRAASYRYQTLLAIEERKKSTASLEESIDGIPLGSETEDGFEIKAIASGSGSASSSVSFRKPYQILDWLGTPFALVAFYVIPCLNAIFRQVFTNKLDYKVSLKPTTRAVGSGGDVEMDVRGETDQAQQDINNDNGNDDNGHGHGTNEDGIDMNVVKSGESTLSRTFLEDETRRKLETMTSDPKSVVLTSTESNVCSLVKDGSRDSGVDVDQDVVMQTNNVDENGVDVVKNVEGGNDGMDREVMSGGDAQNGMRTVVETPAA